MSYSKIHSFSTCCYDFEMQTLIPIDAAVDSIDSGGETGHSIPSVVIRGVTEMFTIDLSYLRTKIL